MSRSWGYTEQNPLEVGGGLDKKPLLGGGEMPLLARGLSLQASFVMRYGERSGWSLISFLPSYFLAKPPGPAATQLASFTTRTPWSRFPGTALKRPFVIGMSLHGGRTYLLGEAISASRCCSNAGFAFFACFDLPLAPSSPVLGFPSPELWEGED